jgi:hypothetical protein
MQKLVSLAAALALCCACSFDRRQHPDAGDDDDDDAPDARTVDGAVPDAGADGTLTVSIAGDGGRVISTPAGIDCPGTCSAAFTPASNVTLTATSAPGSPDAMFDGWGDDCSAGGLARQCTLVAAGSQTATAAFLPEWSLSAPAIGIADVAVAADGAIAVTGSHIGSLGFAPASACPAIVAATRDVFIAKFDRAGQCVWLRSFGGAGPDEGLGIAFDTAGSILIAAFIDNVVTVGDGVVLTGSGGDGAAFKFSSAGTALWAQRVDGVGQSQSHSISVEPTTGDVFVTATYYGTSLTITGCSAVSNPQGDAATDAVVARLDGDSGTCIWAEDVGSDGNDGSVMVAADPAGGAVYVGMMQRGAAQTFFGTPMAGDGASKFWLGRINVDGTPQWVERHGGDVALTGALAVAPTGGDVVVSGTFKGTLTLDNDAVGLPAMTAPTSDPGDMFVARVASNGVVEAQRDLDNTGASPATLAARGLAIAPDGTVLLVGSFYGMLDAGPSFLLSAGSGTAGFLAVLDATLVTSSAVVYGTGTVAVTVVGGKVAYDPAGNGVIAGSVHGASVDLGEGVYTAPDGEDALFLGRFASPP